MFSLTKRTGYALVALSHLARLPEGELASAREIGERFGVPVPLLMNVLKRLAAAGYVASVRGVRGGYRLARPAVEISLADVVSAIEGPVALAECLADGDGRDGCRCQVLARCPLVGPLRKVHRRLQGVLADTTLAELAGQAALTDN